MKLHGRNFLFCLSTVSNQNYNKKSLKCLFFVSNSILNIKKNILCKKYKKKNFGRAALLIDDRRHEAEINFGGAASRPRRHF